VALVASNVSSDALITNTVFSQSRSLSSDTVIAAVSISNVSSFWSDCTWENNELGIFLLEGSHQFADNNFTSQIASGISLSQTWDVLVRNCLFQNNTGLVHGGAVIVESSQIVFLDCKFWYNSAGSVGGAVWIGGDSHSAATIMDSLFENNVVMGDRQGGGAIFVDLSSSITVGSTEFIGNNADDGIDGGGGAIFLMPETTSSFTESLFLSNSANYSSGGGGAVYIAPLAVASFTNCEFHWNTAKVEGGGAIYVSPDGVIVLDGTNVFANNLASRGGGIGATTNVTIADAQFFNNVVSADKSLI